MGLPSGYRRFQYIQSTGDQYIDTGIQPNHNTRVKIKLSTNQSGSFTVIGSDTGWTENGFALGTGFLHYGVETTSLEGLNNGAVHEVYFNKNEVSLDGVVVATMNPATFSVGYNMALFANNRTNSIQEKTTMELYSCQIYSNDTLIRDFVPCENASGVPGLFDLVNNYFYPSATSEPFVGNVYASIQNGDILDFDYTGSVHSITLPKGKYKLECWGAQGGYRSDAKYGGKGGYAVGILTLQEDTTIFVYVGGSGNTGGTSGGFNGGGERDTHPGGGGATDIRVITDSLFARVIVAAGGGSDGASNKTGMHGGGLTGGSTSQSYGTGGGGASQTAGGTGGNNNDGTFGKGGRGIARSGGFGGAGGGGWYGGGGAYPNWGADNDRGGGGGSSFLWTGLNAPSGYLLTSKHYLASASTIAGSDTITSPSGTTETGHSGDGYARITVIRVFADDACPNMPVRVNGVWKTSASEHVKVAGTWKVIAALFTKSNGVWKETQ